MDDLSTTRSNFNRRRQESVSRKLATLQSNNVNVKTPSQNRRNTEVKAVREFNKENLRSMTPRQQEEAMPIVSKSLTRTAEVKELPNYLSLEKNLGFTKQIYSKSKIIQLTKDLNFFRG